MAEIRGVVLAGGSGTRLWPVSREMYPKQFQTLVGQDTLLQNTLERVGRIATQAPLIVCNEEHRFLVADQCRTHGFDWGAIILEPKGRNTAPAIALAALQCVQESGDDIMLVLPSDHHIEDVDEFIAVMGTGIELAEAGKMVTFGVVPTRPETGYGYIRSGEVVLETKGRVVAAFTEKPDADSAREFVSSGDYLWNSGMFMFRAERYLEELETHRPDILAACRAAMSDKTIDLDFVRPSACFADCPSESIDYAVMEKTADATVIPLKAGWSDVGSWDAVWDIADKDGHNNAAVGDVMMQDTANCLVYGSDRLIATVGISDTVVVETSDAVLVADRNKVQDVKGLVEAIRGCTRSEHHVHDRVYRPWGSYETIELGPRFQVKRITVNPGAALSLQMHHHRAEHWIVVSGTAMVDKDDEQFILSENESTYIPLGTKHRLSNPGRVPLDLIEVQVGTYLGEDDIVRFQDQYNRS